MKLVPEGEVFIKYESVSENVKVTVVKVFIKFTCCMHYSH